MKSLSRRNAPCDSKGVEYDFSNAPRALEIGHLAKLQAEMTGKSRITIRVDKRTLATFKVRAKACGGNYQTLMNEALTQFAEGGHVTGDRVYRRFAPGD